MAKGKIALKLKWCKGCGLCAAFCPKKVLEIKHEKVVIINGEACISCGICQQHCPDYAIFLIEEGE